MSIMSIDQLKQDVLRMLREELEGYANNHPWMQPAIGRSIRRTESLFDAHTRQRDGLPPVTDAPLPGHCCYHWPQFSHLAPERLRKELEHMIAIRHEPLIGEGDAKHDEKYAKYAQAVALLKADQSPATLLRAVEIAGEAFYGPGRLYLDKRGGVAVYEPCCM